MLKKKKQTKTISMQIYPSQHKWLRKKAAAESISVSRFVRELLAKLKAA